MHACMYVCMLYGCVCVCMCIYTYICIRTWTHTGCLLMMLAALMQEPSTTNPEVTLPLPNPARPSCHICRLPSGRTSVQGFCCVIYIYLNRIRILHNTSSIVVRKGCILLYIIYMYVCVIHWVPMMSGLPRLRVCYCSCVLPTICSPKWAFQKCHVTFQPLIYFYWVASPYIYIYTILTHISYDN